MWSLESSTFPELLPMLSRSEGVHVSDVIKHMSKYRGIPFDESNRGMAELGCCMEWAFIERYYRHHPGQYFQPGELELEDIYGTLDLAKGSSVEDIDEVLEFKFRYHLPPALPDDTSNDLSVEYDSRLWAPRTQLMSYCRMAECEVGELIIVFMPQHPVPIPYRRWRKRFTRAELIRNWAIIESCARTMEKSSGAHSDSNHSTDKDFTNGHH